MFIYTALALAASLSTGTVTEPVQVPEPAPAPQFYQLTCTVSADNPLTPEVEPGTFTMLYYGSDPAVAASPNCEAAR